MSQSLERFEVAEVREGLKGQESQERKESVTEGRRSLTGVTDAGAKPESVGMVSDTAAVPSGKPPEKAAGASPDVSLQSAEKVSEMPGAPTGSGAGPEWSPEKDAQAVRACIGGKRRKGRRLALPEDGSAMRLTAEQRLLLLDTWQRSGLCAGEFAWLIGMSKHTLYAWKKRFRDGVRDSWERLDGDGAGSAAVGGGFVRGARGVADGQWPAIRDLAWDQCVQKGRVGQCGKPAESRGGPGSARRGADAGGSRGDARPFAGVVFSSGTPESSYDSGRSAGATPDKKEHETWNEPSK